MVWLTDVGVVSWVPGAQARCWDLAQPSLELPRDAGVGAVGAATGCSGHAVCAVRSAHWPRGGRLSGASQVVVARGSSDCCKEADQDSSTSWECREPTSVGRKGVFTVGYNTVEVLLSIRHCACSITSCPSPHLVGIRSRPGISH